MTVADADIRQLRARVSRLESVVRGLTWQLPAEVRDSHREAVDPSDADSLQSWLRDMGLTRDPTAEERGLAAEWDALPEAEKQAHLHLMDSLDLEPSLSQIISEGRR